MAVALLSLYRQEGKGKSRLPPRTGTLTRMDPHISLLLLSLLFSPLSANPNPNPNPNPNRSPSNVNYHHGPRRFAEDLIKDLNHLPGIQGMNDNGEEAMAVADDHTSARLVERRLRLDILGDSGSESSVEELGHHTGYYSLEHTHAARMFYFFFESRGKSSDPVVLWLTGGPGCSAASSVFYENGPFYIADNMSLIWNDYGFDKASHMIYVDQPTGTGFSYSTDLRDIRYGKKGVSDDLYDFLQAFYKEHPQYLKNELYIAGDSYAGHFIPAVTERVHKGNKEHQGTHLNIKGFSIGNGLTDPAIQFGSLTEYALNMGAIGQSAHDRIETIYPLCKIGLNYCGSSGTVSCVASYMACYSMLTSLMNAVGNINFFDIRKECWGSICYDQSNMDKFLNQKSVKNALGVNNRKFVSCSTIIPKVMLADFTRNYEVGIPALIKDGIKLLVYAGEYDLFFNWLGISRWVHAMEWSGQKIFAETPMSSFIVDGKEAGLLKTYGALSLLKVHDAGHMVPMDQPKVALEMLKSWMGGSLGEESSVPVVSDM